MNLTVEKARNLSIEDVTLEGIFPDKGVVIKGILVHLDPDMSKMLESALKVAWTQGVQAGLKLSKEIYHSLLKGDE